MHPRRGFTLLELSIVLVIVGLVAAAIVGGESMIGSARLRRAATQIGEYRAAVAAFRQKYNAWPGDMKDAQSYWGVQHVTAATCEVTASTDAKTCNGNGDGFIAKASVTTTSSEKFRAWQQLASAGMVGGSFSGVAGTGGGGYQALTLDRLASPATQLPNVPGGPFESSGFSFSYGLDSIAAGDTDSYDGPYGNAITFGRVSAASETNLPVVSPGNAREMDVKLDDGKPAGGQILSYKMGSAMAPDCATTTVKITAEYNIAKSENACALIFLLSSHSN